MYWFAFFYLSIYLSLYILQHIVLIFYWFFLFILSLFSYTNHQVKKKKKVELSQAERSVDSLDCVWMAFRHWCPYRNRQTDRQRRKKKKTTMMKKREMMDKNVSSSSIFLFSIWIIIMSLCVPSRPPSSIHPHVFVTLSLTELPNHPYVETHTRVCVYFICLWSIKNWFTRFLYFYNY